MGSNITDHNAKIIQEFMDENDLYLLNDGTGTRITFNGIQTPLDLTFVSSNLSKISRWNVQDNTLGSDHSLIKIQLYQNRKINKNHNSISNSWNYKKAKWSLFSQNLQTLQYNRNYGNGN